MSINRPKILFSIATASLLLTNISAIEITDSRGSIADASKADTGDKKSGTITEFIDGTGYVEYAADASNTDNTATITFASSYSGMTADNHYELKNKDALIKNKDQQYSSEFIQGTLTIINQGTIGGATNNYDGNSTFASIHNIEHFVFNNKGTINTIGPALLVGGYVSSIASSNINSVKSSITQGTVKGGTITNSGTMKNIYVGSNATINTITNSGTMSSLRQTNNIAEPVIGVAGTVNLIKNESGKSIGVGSKNNQDYEANNAGIKVYSGGYIGTIDNYGTIHADATKIKQEFATSGIEIAANATIDLIKNSGTISTSEGKIKGANGMQYSAAINSVGYGTIGTILNETNGVIKGGEYLINAKNVKKFDNKGTIIATGTNTPGNNSYGEAPYNRTGNSYAAVVLTNNTGKFTMTEFSNTGTIKSTKNSGIYVESSGAGMNANNLYYIEKFSNGSNGSNALIEGAQFGMQIGGMLIQEASGNGGWLYSIWSGDKNYNAFIHTLTNYGTIKGSKGGIFLSNGHYAKNSSNDGQGNLTHITNSGLIDGTFNGSLADNDTKRYGGITTQATAIELNNTGTIKGDYGIYMYGTGLDTNRKPLIKTSTIINSGLIQGEKQAGIRVDPIEELIIENKGGTIKGKTDGAVIASFTSIPGSSNLGSSHISTIKINGKIIGEEGTGLNIGASAGNDSIGKIEVETGSEISGKSAAITINGQNGTKVDEIVVNGKLVTTDNTAADIKIDSNDKKGVLEKLVNNSNEEIAISSEKGSIKNIENGAGATTRILKANTDGITVSGEGTTVIEKGAFTIDTTNAANGDDYTKIIQFSEGAKVQVGDQIVTNLTDLLNLNVASDKG